MHDEWRAYISGHPDAHLSADVTAFSAGHYPEDHGEPHMMAVEDDEPRPEETPGASPTWFVIAFVLVLICCGSTAAGVLIAWFAGAFS